MTWTERRRYFLALERRVLAGEPKAAILADQTSAGADRREVARMLARMVSPPRRRLYRWAQRTIVVLGIAAGLTSALLPLISPDADRLSLVATVPCSVLLFGLPLADVLRWRSAGYTLMASGAVIALFWNVRPLLRDLSRLGAGGVLSAVLCAALIGSAPVLWRRLFPDVGWADGDPRRSADGEYLLAD